MFNIDLFLSPFTGAAFRRKTLYPGSVARGGPGTLYGARALLGALVVGAVLLAGGCYRVEEETVTIAVPQMKSWDCGKLLLDQLTPVKGIQSAQPDIDRQQLLVTYDSTLIAVKNIEHLIAGAGFDANGVPASPEARAALPEGCR